MVQFTAIFEQVGDWWVGYVEELPGANTQGRSLGETRENLREAIRLILESNQQLILQEIQNPDAVVREPIAI